MDAFADFELARLDDEAAADTMADVELADVREPANPDPGVPDWSPPRIEPASASELSAWMSQWIANEAQRAGIPADLLPTDENTSGAAFARAANVRGLSARQVIVDDVAGPGEYPNRVCRSCGCSDLDCSGCIERTGRPCSWTDADLCSACAQFGPPAPRAMVPRTAAEIEPYPPGCCYVCGADLPADRALLCPACADPKSPVAAAARMFPTDPATMERAARLYGQRITRPTSAPSPGPVVVPDRVCIVPGCGQAIGPNSWDGRHCTSCYAGELGDPRAPR